MPNPCFHTDAREYRASKGTLLKIIKINDLFVFEIVVSRGHATASQIRQPWDPSPCNDPRDRGAQYIFRR